MSNEFIFVYGTLCKASDNAMSHLFARYTEYVGLATLQGVLYEIDGYPGAIESSNPDDKVHGELHTIIDSTTLLPLLDDYEECSARFPQPHEYQRKRLSVTLTNDTQVSAWVYIYNHDVSQRQKIARYQYE